MGENAVAAARGTSEGLGSPQASRWWLCGRICCAARRTAGKAALALHREMPDFGEGTVTIPQPGEAWSWGPLPLQ